MMTPYPVVDHVPMRTFHTASEAQAAAERRWNRTPPSAMHAVLAFVGDQVRATFGSGPAVLAIAPAVDDTIVSARPLGYGEAPVVVVRTGHVSIQAQVTR